MSAFLVSSNTINKVLWHLRHEVQTNWGLRDALRKLDPDFEVSGYGCDASEDFDWSEYLAHFGRTMYRLNMKSLQERYGEKVTENDRMDINNYKYDEVIVDEYQGLKALNCFLYQSCEGLCVNDPLYVFLNQELKSALAMSIIYELPRYDSAEWG